MDTWVIAIVAIVCIVVLGLIGKLSISRNASQPSRTLDAVDQEVLFEPFRIIPKQLESHPLIELLSARDRFDFESAQNTLMLPVRQALADKLRLSVYSDNPLPSYLEGVENQLNKRWHSEDGIAAQNGDPLALDRISDDLLLLTDTIRAGLVNGDVVVDVQRP